MSRRTKSNIPVAPVDPADEHIMTPEQLARRFECNEQAVGIPGVVEIGRYRYATAYERLRTRAHPDGIEICFLSRGQQTYRVNDTIYRLRGGDQYLVFPGEPHDSAGMPEEKGELYWVFIKLKSARQPLLFLDAKASGELRKALLNLPSRHFAAEPGTRELLEQIVDSLRGPRAWIDRIATAGMVLRFLLATIHGSHGNRRAAPSPRIQRCLTFIHAHPAEPLDVPQLARLVQLSPSRFKTRFRAETGLPPWEYVLRHKLGVAEEQLRKPGATVTEVAHALGFSSSQYFATVFRRFTGRSPSGSMKKAR